MGKPSDKLKSVIKFLLPLIIENWGKIAVYLSGFTLTGIVAGLGNFISVLSGFINIRILLNIPLWLIISVMPIIFYGIIRFIVKTVNKLKKPAYLKFTSMEYTDTKNNIYKLKWGYKLENNIYVVSNIYSVCPVCGCGLAYTESADYVYCPICRDQVRKIFDDEDAVTKIIWHKIRNGLF